MNFGNGYHISRVVIAAHGLEYFTHILLYQPGYFMLACCFHAAKVLIL